MSDERAAGRRGGDAADSHHGLGDLASELLKRAASPTLLGAAAGAAVGARLATSGGTAPERTERRDVEPEDATSTDAEEAEPEDDAARERSEPVGDVAEEQEESPPGDDAEEPEEPEPAERAEAQPTERAETEPAERAGAEPQPSPLQDDERGRLVRRAQQYARELSGREVDSVSAVERTERGWLLGLEVVEVPRIPSSTDVLASYELLLGADGELLEYRRTRRYYRNQIQERVT